MRSGLITAVLGAVTLMATPAFSADTILQDYEGTSLVEPFHLAPSFSGTSQGINRSSASNNTITLDDTGGAMNSLKAARLKITDSVTESGAGGWAWQIRFNPNNLALASVANPLFDTTGYVGFWLKVDSSVQANIQVSPSLEPMNSMGTSLTGNATNGILKTVIKDGQWHLYEWNMDLAADFPLAWRDVYDLNSTLGDTILEDRVSFDSIAIVATGSNDVALDAEIFIDRIGFNNAGHMAVPEPGVMGALSAGVMGMLGLRRRRA